MTSPPGMPQQPMSYCQPETSFNLKRGDFPEAAKTLCKQWGTPVVAAMMALVLADHKLLHRAQGG